MAGGADVDSCHEAVHATTLVVQPRGWIVDFEARLFFADAYMHVGRTG